MNMLFPLRFPTPLTLVFQEVSTILMLLALRAGVYGVHFLDSKKKSHD